MRYLKETNVKKAYIIFSLAAVLALANCNKKSEETSETSSAEQTESTVTAEQPAAEAGSSETAAEESAE